VEITQRPGHHLADRPDRIGQCLLRDTSHQAASRVLLGRGEIEKMSGDPLAHRAERVDRRLLQGVIQPAVQFLGDGPADPRVAAGRRGQRAGTDPEQAGRLHRLHSDAGRAAHQHRDPQHVTRPGIPDRDLPALHWIARQMVGRWGMSPAIGPITVLPPPGQESPYGLDGVAPATKELVDTEARRIIEECYQQALKTLRDNRNRLDRLAHTLLQQETLGEDEAYAAAGVSRDTAPAAPSPGTVPATVASGQAR
jgi:hypothetical protein